jgi:hypothetical protein
MEGVEIQLGSVVEKLAGEKEEQSSQLSLQIML